MHLDEFWLFISKIDKAALERGEEEQALAPLAEILSTLPDEELFSFADHLAQRLYDIDGQRYFNAAGDGAGSDDSFLYLRCYVVAKGRAFYQAVQEDPSQIPQTIDEWCEPLLYLAPEAWAANNDSDPADYEHVSPVSYESGSNGDLWR